MSQPDKTPPSVTLYVCTACGRIELGRWGQRGKHWSRGEQCDGKPEAQIYIYEGPAR